MKSKNKPVTKDKHNFSILKEVNHRLLCKPQQSNSACAHMGHLIYTGFAKGPTSLLCSLSFCETLSFEFNSSHTYVNNLTDQFCIAAHKEVKDSGHLVSVALKMKL